MITNVNAFIRPGTRFVYGLLPVGTLTFDLKSEAGDTVTLFFRRDTEEERAKLREFRNAAIKACEEFAPDPAVTIEVSPAIGTDAGEPTKLREVHGET